MDKTRITNANKQHARRSAGAGEIKEINMIEIRYLQAESGANKFGTCNCCGKSSSEDPLMISIKFSYYGHGTLICLCDDCKKKLIEALPPANNSEIPNSSDTISRQAAIDALKNDMASLDHIIKGMSANDVRLDAYVSQRNQVNYDIYTINNLPPAQPVQCEDAVSRQTLKDGFTEMCNLICPYSKKQQHVMCGSCLMGTAFDVLEATPPVTPKQRTGKWIKLDMHRGMADHKCTACEQECYVPTCMGEPLYAFCPNCGAEMEVTE